MITHYNVSHDSEYLHTIVFHMTVLCLHTIVVDIAMLCFSLVKMVFGFANKSNSTPTWRELRHAILRNFGGLDDVNPVEVFAKHLTQVDRDAAVCFLVFFVLLLFHKHFIKQEIFATYLYTFKT